MQVYRLPSTLFLWGQLQERLLSGTTAGYLELMVGTVLNTHSVKEDIHRKPMKDQGNHSAWKDPGWLWEAGFRNLLCNIICNLVQFRFSVLSPVVRFSDDPSARIKLWKGMEALTAGATPRLEDLLLVSSLPFPLSWPFPFHCFLWKPSSFLRVIPSYSLWITALASLTSPAATDAC